MSSSSSARARTRRSSGRVTASSEDSSSPSVMSSFPGNDTTNCIDGEKGCFTTSGQTFAASAAERDFSIAAAGSVIADTEAACAVRTRDERNKSTGERRDGMSEIKFKKPACQTRK